MSPFEIVLLFLLFVSVLLNTRLISLIRKSSECIASQGELLQALVDSGALDNMPMVLMKKVKRMIELAKTFRQDESTNRL